MHFRVQIRIRRLLFSDYSDDFRSHPGDDFLGSFADVVFHCGDLGLGVEQVGIGIHGDHVAHGRLVCQFVNPYGFIRYCADGVVMMVALSLRSRIISTQAFSFA